MIRRSTWYVIGLFSLVLAGALFFQRWQGRQDPEAAATPTAIELFDFDTQVVAAIQIEDRSGKAVRLSRNDQGLWELTEPAGQETDLARAEAAASQLVALRSTAQMEDSAGLEVYGLENPTHTLTVTLNDGEQYLLQVGDITPIQNGYYVRLNENPPLVVNKFSLDSILSMLVEPPVQPTATPTPEVDEMGTPTPGVDEN